MSAVPGEDFASPARAGGFMTAIRPVPGADQRVVAIAADAVELLRTGSDLARLLGGCRRADVLLAAEEFPAAPTGDDPDDDPDDWANDDEVEDQVHAAAAALGHANLALHRLALRPPLGPEVEDDLVAALSELIGFDPEPDVYCIAPATPADNVLLRAARRIARVYGLPLLRYRCRELSLVSRGADPDDERISSPSLRRAARV